MVLYHGLSAGPANAVLGINDRDPHGGQFVTDPVSFRPVFLFAGLLTGLDQAADLGIILTLRVLFRGGL